jgi:hypothetical protein
MELLKIVKRRSFLSDLIYNILNVALAVALLVIVQTADSTLPAFLLVILSKWRVLAVRPRFWVANIQANLVDLIVSTSMVIFLYTTQGHLALQIVLTLLYIAWLLVLKPRSKRHLVVLQAGIAAFVGVTALYTVSFAWPASAVVVLMWLIGYATARHVFGAYEEKGMSLLCLAWGYLIAQVGWLAYHWAVAYSLPLAGSLKIPQVAIIVLGLSFVAQQVYGSYMKHKEVRPGEILLPILLSSSVIAILLFVFSSVGFGQH